jgi:hypothetical protein
MADSTAAAGEARWPGACDGEATSFARALAQAPGQLRHWRIGGFPSCQRSEETVAMGSARR